MPADDLVLNVRQIAGYSPVSNAPPAAAILMQIAGLGSAYNSISPQAFVGTALSQGGDMSIAGALAVQRISGGSGQFSNAAVNVFSAQKACIVDFAATYAAIGGVPIATIDDISNLNAALRAASVWSFNGRVGDVRMWIDDIRCAGGAPIYSPRFEGSPRACTPPPTSNSSRLATTAFVQNAIAGGLLVSSFNGRTGAVTLEAADVTALTLPYAPIDSPNFTGYATSLTPPLGTANGQIATTAYVMNAVAESTTGVVSFNGRTGIVVLGAADLTAAGGALLASPTFTGTPAAPTAAPGTSTTQLATTAFVMANSGTGFAPINSPAFTGVPTAPTAAVNTNTTQIATTAFVISMINSVDAGVTTFNGRTGAVTLIANDVSAAGGATLQSPAFTGTPTAPTAAVGTSTTQLATTAFVMAQIGAANYLPLSGGVLSGPLTVNGLLTTAAHLTGTATASNATINMTALGSGVNGPATTQIGLALNITKDNWLTGTARTGEIDGLFIQARQGDPSTTGSDCGGIDVEVIGTGNGYLTALEWDVEQWQAPSGTPLYQMHGGFGNMNAVNSQRTGYGATANFGTMNAAFEAQNITGQGYWGNLLVNIRDGATTLVIDDRGNITTAGSLTATAGVNSPGAILTAQNFAMQSPGSAIAYYNGAPAAATSRWTMNFGVGTEGTSSSGQDFNLACFSNTGAALYTALAIRRASGVATFAESVNANGFGCQAGVNGGRTGSLFSLDWISPYFNFYVGSTLVGSLTPSCDYRIKQNVTPLTSMWAKVKALRPIAYMHREYIPERGAEARPLFAADGVEHWGFVAHELQETLTPTAASGVKGAPNELQSPNLLAILATLTKALQEAMARIETLEARMT
jgi:hypothetical protein